MCVSFVYNVFETVCLWCVCVSVCGVYFVLFSCVCCVFLLCVFLECFVYVSVWCVIFFVFCLCLF